VTATPAHHHGRPRHRRHAAVVRRRRLVAALGAVAVVVLAVVLLTAPTSSSLHLAHTADKANMSTTTTTSAQRATATTSTTRPPGPRYAVASSTVTLVDPSRPTPARSPYPAKSGRVLRTIIRKPIGVSGPLPLVVFIHGRNSEPEAYEVLLDTWAAAGYLVLAPECPGSAMNLPGTPARDRAAQALDVSFVITQALAGVAGPVDPNRIAAAGHSDGGMTMAILALAPQYQDHRIKAYLALVGVIPPDVSAPWGATRMPGVLLVAVGTADEYGNEPAATQLYDTAQMTKAFIKVPGGTHTGPFIGAGPVADSVRAATVDFLHLVLDSPGPVSAAALTQTLESPPGASAYVVTAADN
jgi:dienelactone hydrolase